MFISVTTKRTRYCGSEEITEKKEYIINVNNIVSLDMEEQTMIVAVGFEKCTTIKNIQDVGKIRENLLMS